MDKIWTPDALVRELETMTPAHAVDVTGSIDPRRCSTPLIDRILIDGEVIELSLVGGRYGAGKVRVSTKRQRTGKEANPDGFSESDQVRRIINHFVALRQSFRIFTDCGLSGSLPPNDPYLMKKMWTKKAAMYGRIFDKVFLSEFAAEKFTKLQLLELKGYRDARVKKILAGKLGVEEEPVEPEDPEAETEKLVLRGRPRITLDYRPGLTLLMQSLDEIHTVAVTDLSRLCRSQVLAAELAEQFIEHKVKLEGLVETIKFFNSTEFGDEIAKVVLSMLAEQKLQEVCLHSLRGLYAMLESGRPHGTPPHWITKNENGKAVLKPGPAETVKEIVEMYLSSDDVSANVIRNSLRERGVKMPSGREYGTHTIYHLLKNPALMGVQKNFGISWHIYPALVTPEQFELIQIKVTRRRSYRYSNNSVKEKDGYLMTSMVRCHCGTAVVHAVTGRRVHLYRCRRKNESGASHHGAIYHDSLNDFINGLMSAHPLVVLGSFKNDAKYTELKAQIKHLEHQAAELKVQQRMAHEAARNRAVEQLALSNIDDSNPMFSATVDTLTRAFLVDKNEHAQHIEDTLTKLRLKLNGLVPADKFLTIEERVRCWNGLSNTEKNTILLLLFEKFQLRKVDGQQFLEVRLNNSTRTVMPLIPLILPAGRVRNRTCLLPTVEEWLLGFTSVEEQP